MEEKFENVWGKAYGLGQRGRHDTFDSALNAALKDLLAEKNDFFDTLVNDWQRLFPGLPARPGRYDDGRIVLYVRTAPTRFVVLPKLRQISARLAELPGAPARIDLRVEVHAQ